MVRIGLSSNRSLIFLVLLGPLLDQVDKRVDRVIQSGAVDFITNGTDITLATGLGLAAMAAIGFVLLLVLASITGAFLRYHKFSLVADEDVLRSTGGLLTRHEHSVNLAKIQTLEARQNPILRMFRRFRLRAKQASSGQPGKGKHFVIPLCTEQQLPDVEKEVFHDEFEHMEMQPGSSSFNSIHKRYIRSRILYTGVMPAVFLSSLFLALGGIGGLVLLLWIPIDAFFVWMLHRKYGFIVNEEGMVLRRGLFGYRVNAFLHRKVQRVSVTQTIAQQRRELATLRFYMASGSLKLPYIEYELAKQIRDFMLYRVESSRLAWH
jgi:putative membrane protein